MTSAADSSITIAALVADHDAREVAEDALQRSTATIAHVAIETFSVLTRLPPSLRLTSGDAAAIIDARLPPTYATLSGRDYVQAPSRLAAAGVSGGATYDGLIALTALKHGLELLTRDRRAARSYRALGTRFTLVE